MPYIRVSSTKKLSDEQQAALISGLGKAIAIMPGKDERGLMVDMEDGKTMYFGGKKADNLVFLDVRYFSNFEYHIKKNFTVAVLDEVSKVVGTAKDHIFLTLSEYNTWGGFGGYIDEYYKEQE